MSRALREFGHEQLLAELRAREADTPVVPPLACSRSACRRPQRSSVSLEPLGDLTGIRAELKRYETPEVVEALRDVQKLVYGVDDRSDLYAVNDCEVRTDASSVVAVVDAGDLVDNGDGTWTMSGPTFQSDYNLCDHEPFGSQPSIAFCSGFLVDPSLVVTAGHCVHAGNLDSVRFVFGYEMTSETTARTVVPAIDVCRASRIIAREETSSGADWAVVQLDRPVVHRPSAEIRRAGSISDGTSLHVVGHPAGLPLKYAPGASVRDNTAASYFVANLDTYGGNSGSPVFDSTTHMVEGVLVRGDTDFVWSGGCFVSMVCPADGCRGEDCTRTTEFSRFVPENRMECIGFDPGAARVEHVDGRWKIVDGDMPLKDFGASQADAERALSIFRHYGLNAQCFVGRTRCSNAMEFYLSNGRAPEGPLADDDCIGFDPSALEVRRVQDRWKITEGSHWILDFDQFEAHARQALSFLLRFSFRYICFVGRPHVSMTYFRR